MRCALHLVLLKIKSVDVDQEVRLFRSFCSSWVSPGDLWFYRSSYHPQMLLFRLNAQRQVEYYNNVKTYKRNKTGPRIEHCGTPEVT
jgi:hypothetical protein